MLAYTYRKKTNLTLCYKFARRYDDIFNSSSEKTNTLFFLIHKKKYVS